MHTASLASPPCQLFCLESGDKVPYRLHWPKHVDLRINTVPYRPYSRALNASMGINQRDDAASIGTLCLRGRNALTVSAADGGAWVVGLQLARRRSLAQVKAMMAPPEALEAAVARVKREMSGGGGGGGSDDDDGDGGGVMVSHQVTSLKDPMSGQRIAVPARLRGASGLQPFDLDSLLSIVASNRKWQDPSTLRNATVRDLQVGVEMGVCWGEAMGTRGCRGDAQHELMMSSLIITPAGCCCGCCCGIP